MYEAFYKANQYVSLSNIGMLLFAALFAGVIAWVFIERKERFDEAARLPLQDDSGAPASTGERIP